MTLELSHAETEELQHALGGYLSELRMEIADTDSYDYRQNLKARKAVLNGILAKLAEPSNGSILAVPCHMATSS
jgi:hypothetical protein